MKKIVLLASVSLVSFASFAQKSDRYSNSEDFVPVYNSAISLPVQSTGAMNKSTGATDSFLYTSLAYYSQVFDTSTTSRIDQVLPADSGYWFGTNIFQNKAYAEQFSFDYLPDTTLRVLGFRAIFGGHLTGTAAKNVVFNVWSKSAQSAAGTKKFNEGLPGTSLKSLTLPIKAIGIGNGVDTFKNYFFATPLNGLNKDFFMGYELPTYTWPGSLGGDTLGIRSSRGGYGFGTSSYLNGTDTIHANKNVARNAAGTWFDMYWNYGLNRNMSIVPIVQWVSNNIPNSVSGLTRNNLTFFGNYPNPAVNSTNIRFSVKQATDVKIEISDLQGKVVSVAAYPKLAAGEHRIPVSVAGLAAGNYVYMIQTGEGDAIAAQMTVIK